MCGDVIRRGRRRDEPSCSHEVIDDGLGKQEPPPELAQTT